ncbi:hypothetical protein vseg_004826 [Gypsophila vaccaria]
MSKLTMYLAILLFLGLVTQQAGALVPFGRGPLSPLWDIEDPFRILEQAPLSLPKTGLLEQEALALARADWKETESEHIITLDIPGMKREDVKIEVEETRVLRVSGERKVEKDEKEGDKWHRVERTSGKFWRQFRLPVNADLENVKAELQNGVLKISVPKIAEEKRKKNRVIDIVGGDDVKSGAQEVKATI